MPLHRVISGGQTGVDQAALWAAKSLDLATGGWAPRGYLTEDGPNPALLQSFGLVEHESPLYSPRRRANIRDADATLILAHHKIGPGTKRTIDEALASGKPWKLAIAGEGDVTPRDVAEWIAEHGIGTLNVAGPRASSAPGFEEKAERFLVAVLRLAGSEPSKQSPLTL